MTSLQIRNESDRARVLGHIAGMDITKPKKLAITEVDRSGEQNKALHAALAECADSLHGEMLQKFGGRLPDDMHPVTRREYDRDMAEVAGYRAAMGKGEQS